MFTTLHREFIALKRKAARHPQFELHMMEPELPTIDPEAIDRLDHQAVLKALSQIDERFRVPLALYHLDDLSYREIAEMLEVPIGTVMSRLSRGREQWLELLRETSPATATGNIIPIRAAARA